MENFSTRMYNKILSASDNFECARRLEMAISPGESKGGSDDACGLEKQKIPSEFHHHCEISDSFVSSNMKLSNGKNGHGESRLFVSNSENICKEIARFKKIKINIPDKYSNKLQPFVSQDANFRKKEDDRVKKWKKNIQHIQNQTILIKKQNGGQDVNRNYIGQSPHRRKKNKTAAEKENIKKWDTFRKCLVPTKTTLKFIIDNDELIVKVLYNEEVHRYNKPSGSSFIADEFFDKFSKANNIEIQHAMNCGEHKERKQNGYFWPVDGYHNCEKHGCSGTKDKPCFWNNYVFEFQGTYWHKDKKDKDLLKKQFYIEKGYKWFEISEREFINRKKLNKNIKRL